MIGAQNRENIENIIKYVMLAPLPQGGANSHNIKKIIEKGY
jgi:hypothetical protein